MSTNEIIVRLKEHSGLPVPGVPLPNSAFIDRIQAIQKGDLEADLEGAVEDVVDCIASLNECKKTSSETPRQVLNLEVVYAISGLILLAAEASLTLPKTREGSTQL